MKIKLDKKFTQICKGCKHGKAAHKPGCKMKHCKCGGFES